MPQYLPRAVFNGLISDAEIDPVKKGVPKCPICRKQFPRVPVFGPPLAPAMLAQRERDRIERRLQVIEAEWEISFPGVGPDRASLGDSGLNLVLLAGCTLGARNANSLGARTLADF